jgi:predicted double-glycine peptidase
MGHYSVVVGLDENFVYLQDPELAGLRAVTLENFMNMWFDFGEYPPNGETFYGRRIVVVTPRGVAPAS